MFVCSLMDAGHGTDGVSRLSRCLFFVGLARMQAGPSLKLGHRSIAGGRPDAACRDAGGGGIWDLSKQNKRSSSVTRSHARDARATTLLWTWTGKTTLRPTTKCLNVQSLHYAK